MVLPHPTTLHRTNQHQHHHLQNKHAQESKAFHPDQQLHLPGVSRRPDGPNALRLPPEQSKESQSLGHERSKEDEEVGEEAAVGEPGVKTQKGGEECEGGGGEESPAEGRGGSSEEEGGEE